MHEDSLCNTCLFDFQTCGIYEDIVEDDIVAECPKYEILIDGDTEEY